VFVSGRGTVQRGGRDVHCKITTEACDLTRRKEQLLSKKMRRKKSRKKCERCSLVLYCAYVRNWTLKQRLPSLTLFAFFFPLLLSRAQAREDEEKRVVVGG
jgi:hypothetical protein